MSCPYDRPFPELSRAFLDLPEQGLTALGSYANTSAATPVSL